MYYVILQVAKAEDRAVEKAMRLKRYGSWQKVTRVLKEVLRHPIILPKGIAKERKAMGNTPPSTSGEEKAMHSDPNIYKEEHHSPRPA